MTDYEKMTNLNEYIMHNLGMELMDAEMDKIARVKDEIKVWEKVKQDEEIITLYKEVIAQLKKFEKYNCLYALDCETGGLYRQGFVIINDNMEYVGFVITV